MYEDFRTLGQWGMMENPRARCRAFLPTSPSWFFCAVGRTKVYHLRAIYKLTSPERTRGNSPSQAYTTALGVIRSRLDLNLRERQVQILNAPPIKYFNARVQHPPRSDNIFAYNTPGK